MKKVIEINGMYCAACATNIEKSLNKLDGIKKASVNFVSKKAYVETINGILDKTLEGAVEKAGFKATAIYNKNDAPAPKRLENEAKQWKAKLIGSWVFTFFLALLMYSEMFFGILLVPMKVMPWMMLILSFPILFIYGFSTIKSGLRGFVTFYFSMDSLIALGSLVAYLTGILVFFMNIDNFAGVSGMIMTIFITGKYIESIARGKATSEIKKLLELGAKSATVLRKGKEVSIPISELVIGDIMVIKPGDKIPTDGIVVKGESFIDESMVTGESVPTSKTVKSNVIGATINQDGILHVKATKVGKDTFLSNIIKLVEEAQSTKVPIQKIADKITNIFVPTILALALFTFLAWLFILKADLGLAVGIGIAVLVIACPCALGLAVPISLTVGSGMGAKRGILIRNGEAIQTMKEVNTIVFDKTGTITKGDFSVVDMEGEGNFLELAAALEKSSAHPIAKAIVEEAGLKKYPKVTAFKTVRGKGIRGIINKKTILVGNELLIKEHKIPMTAKWSKIIRGYEEKGQTTMIIALNKKIIGAIAVADSIKEDSVRAIKRLNKLEFRTVMLTGDNEKTAQAIAKQVGIKDVVSQVLPGDKKSKIEELQKKGFVAFVGDGINDAPALKQSNVGIAIGTGTDIAIEAGDIVLAKGDITGVVQAINLSNATFRKIKQNLFWAFFYNAVAIPLAMGGVLSPVVAEFAMALSSITVISNANLLRRKRI